MVKLELQDADLLKLCNGEINKDIIKAARERLAKGKYYKDNTPIKANWLNNEDLNYIYDFIDNNLQYETEKDIRDYQETLLLKIERTLQQCK